MKQVTQIVFALIVAWGITGCDRGGGSAEAPAPAATIEEPAAESGAEMQEAKAQDEAEETSEAAADEITD